MPPTTVVIAPFGTINTNVVLLYEHVVVRNGMLYEDMPGVSGNSLRLRPFKK